jgi:hypothetical protein
MCPRSAVCSNQQGSAGVVWLYNTRLHNHCISHNILLYSARLYNHTTRALPALLHTAWLSDIMCPRSTTYSRTSSAWITTYTRTRTQHELCSARQSSCCVVTYTAERGHIHRDVVVWGMYLILRHLYICVLVLLHNHCIYLTLLHLYVLQNEDTYIEM